MTLHAVIDNREHRGAGLAAVPSAGAASGRRPSAAAPARVALVGNANVGKSVVFGALTGAYATVSNYPGTTVEVTRAPARAGGAEVVDTPGVSSLTPSSEDEQVTRDILLAGVDAVVLVVDAKNLARGLALALQLGEADLPFVVALNMMDEAADHGVAIDAGRLARELGVPIVPTVAVTGHGMRALAAAVGQACRTSRRVHYPAVVERALLRIEGRFAACRTGARSLALASLAGDGALRPWLAARLSPEVLAVVEDERRELERRLERRVAYHLGRARLRAAEELARTVTHVDAVEQPAAGSAGAPHVALALAALAACVALLAGDLGLVRVLATLPGRALAWLVVAAALVTADRSPTLRAALGRWASRRVSGLAVLAVVLYVVYRFVGAFAAGTAVDFLEKTVFATYVSPFAVHAVDRAVAALGTVPAPAATALGLARDLLVGPYGLVTVALTYALAIVLPIVTAFFLAFAVLEDAGYLPRLAVVLNRAFAAMGLNGKAVLPMVLGLGCDTMATLTARIMETPKERLLVTLLLALGVPCSAQLGVTLGILGALPPWALLVWGGVVVGVLLSVGAIAARILPGERSDLILELPPIRRPQLANVLLKTVGRLEWYLKEAVPIFVAGTFVLFVLDATGVLAHLVRASEPLVVGVLGLPSQAAEAFLVGFFRRDYGSAGIYALFAQGALAPTQAVVALVTLTLFVPCVANFFVIVKERGLGTAAAIAGFIFPFAFAVGGVVRVALYAVGLP